MSRQTIFKTACKENFVVLPNELARNKTLSYRARGILVMVLSYPGDWAVHKSWLIEAGTEGKEAVATAFRELEELGYAVYSVSKDETGKVVGSTWTFYDHPVDDSQRTDVCRKRGAAVETEDDGLQGLPDSGVAGKPGTPKAGTLKKDCRYERLSGTKDCRKEELSVEVQPQFKIPANLNTPEFLEAWENWTVFRSEIKHKLTPTTIKMQLALLSKLGPDKAVNTINRSIENGWQGLFPEKSQSDSEQDYYTGGKVQL